VRRLVGVLVVAGHDIALHGRDQCLVLDEVRHVGKTPTLREGGDDADRRSRLDAGSNRAFRGDGDGHLEETVGYFHLAERGELGLGDEATRDELLTREEVHRCDAVSEILQIGDRVVGTDLGRDAFGRDEPVEVRGRRSSLDRLADDQDVDDALAGECPVLGCADVGHERRRSDDGQRHGGDDCDDFALHDSSALSLIDISNPSNFMEIT